MYWWQKCHYKPPRPSNISRNVLITFIMYLQLLRSAKSEMMGSSASELWLEDIVEVVEAVERHAEEAGRVAGLLAALNQALNSANDSNAVAILR